MNKSEAKSALERYLLEYRLKSYQELLQLMDEPETREVSLPSGQKYHLEVQVSWDGRPDGNLRVLASLDDGRWRAVFPLCSDFVISPEGNFVGE